MDGIRAIRSRGILRGRLLFAALVLASLACAATASSAVANAPNPTPSTTVLDSVLVNSNGSRTVTVQGQWSWATQTNCPTARDGVGYQVDWFDGNTANPVGQSNSPVGVLYVGDGIDNIVHSEDVLGGSTAFGNAFWDGVPSSYLDHNLSSAAPTKTDAQNWVSNCNNMDPTTLISSGTWGPISHTYPAGTASITLCPIMYDPHGHGTASGGTIGSSGVGDITAGGKGHNNDNSYEGNGQDNACLKTTFPIVTPTPTPTQPLPPKGVHKKKHKKHHKKHHKHLSQPPKRISGFTG